MVAVVKFYFRHFSYYKLHDHHFRLLYLTKFTFVSKTTAQNLAPYYHATVVYYASVFCLKDLLGKKNPPSSSSSDLDDLIRGRGGEKTHH